MERVAVFIQPYGLGDTCFSQGVARHFIDLGFRVVWPVQGQFLEGLQRAYPHIEWCPDTLASGAFHPEIAAKDPLVIPLFWVHHLPGCKPYHAMRAKYDTFGLDYRTWKEHAKFNRDPSHEMRLCKALGVDLSRPFNLVNRKFRSWFDGTVEIDIQNDYPVVEITHRPEYSLFDYATLIEHAAEIHVANSAIFYLLELLDFKGQAHLYARKPYETGFLQIDYLQTKPYVLHP